MDCIYIYKSVQPEKKYRVNKMSRRTAVVHGFLFPVTSNEQCPLIFQFCFLQIVGVHTLHVYLIVRFKYLVSYVIYVVYVQINHKHRVIELGSVRKKFK